MAEFFTRQHQAYAIQDRQHYDNNRETYLRKWALEVTRGCGNHPEDIQAVREMPLIELQVWYDETQQR